MSDLKDYRQQIDSIDSQMRQLFEKRMETVEQLAVYKKQQGLSITDASREDEIIRNNTKLISRRWRPYYRRFLKYLFKLSKAHQKKIIENS